MSASTLGSLSAMATTSFWCRTISSKLVPCAVSVLADSRFWSSEGKNPLGTSRNATTVSTSAAAPAISATGRRAITHVSVREYTRYAH